MSAPPQEQAAHTEGTRGHRLRCHGGGTHEPRGLLTGRGRPRQEVASLRNPPPPAGGRARRVARWVAREPALGAAQRRLFPTRAPQNHLVLSGKDLQFPPSSHRTMNPKAPSSTAASHTRVNATLQPASAAPRTPITANCAGSGGSAQDGTMQPRCLEEGRTPDPCGSPGTGHALRPGQAHRHPSRSVTPSGRSLGHSFENNGTARVSRVQPQMTAPQSISLERHSHSDKDEWSLRSV